MSSWKDVPEIAKLDFLSAEEKHQVLGGNAARLLDLKA